MSANVAELATEMGAPHSKKGAAIPSEFSKTKENINNNETGDAEEKLLHAMKCSVLQSQNLHTCAIVDLIQREIAEGEFSQVIVRV